MQTRAVIQSHVAGAVGDLKGGSVFKAHAVRKGDAAVCVKHALFGQTALTGVNSDSISD